MGQERHLIIVDDDTAFRESLRTLMRAAHLFERISLFADADQFMRWAKSAPGAETLCDLVLMDLNMPRMNGLELLRAVKAQWPLTCVFMLTIYDEPAQVMAAVSGGADGYLLKGSDPETLLQDISQATRHGAGLSPGLTRTLIDAVRLLSPQPVAHPPSATLSARQVEILRALSEGQSYQEAAQGLNISLDTVRWHIRKIYAVLEVQCAAQAVAKALTLRLI